MPLLVMFILVLLLSGCTGGKKVPKTDLMLFMANAASLWAVDSSGDLFRSTDLAHTYTRVTPPGWFKPKNEGGSAYAIARTMYASDAKQAWLVDGEDNLHRTYNGGKSWKNLGKALPKRFNIADEMQMSFSDALHGWLQTSTGLYRSNDGGASWELVNENKTKEGYLPIFINSQKGFRGSMEGLLRTDNGGKDWHAVPLGRKGAVWAPQFFDKAAGTLMLIDSEKQGSVTYVTSDSGENWQEVKTPPLQKNEFSPSLTFYNKDQGFLVYTALDANLSGRGVTRLFHTADRGKSWTEVELTEPLTGFPLFSSPKNGVVFEPVAGKENYDMKETADGGKTWTPFTPLVKE
jgi:photosystem II stability/assembly factor-like uncharacterized protein